MIRGLKNKVVAAGKSAVDQGKKSASDLANQVASDVLVEGKSIKDSVQQRGRDQTQKLYAGVTPAFSHIRRATTVAQSGQGKRRRRRVKRATTTKRKTKKRNVRRDIFDEL